MSTAETDGHLDLETLAELDEGLVAADRVDALTAHLLGCAHCRDRHATLRTSRALLSTLPADPMPVDVARRMDAALAEAALAGPTVVPLTGARRRWLRHPTLPGLAAAFTALALLGAVAIGYLSHGSHPSGGSAASAPTHRLGLPAQTASFPVTSTGHDYTKASIPRLVPQLLARVTSTSAGAGPVPTPPASASPRPIDPRLARLYGSRGALRACITALTAGGPAQTPLAVDFGRYLGKPAVVVVLPGIASGHVDAWVVGPDCTAASEDLLLYESLPRPAG